MNQKLYTLTLLCFFALNAFGQITIGDDDLVGGQTYNWTADNEYLLDGFVFLEEGSVLNIEAGTVIRGKETPSTNDLASTLIITKGAQIFANGTADNPVIFTAEEDDLTDPDDFLSTDRRLWGGLIILGEAVIARPGGSDVIEGLPTTDPRSAYGGTENGDNSGKLNYVSIRHGGATLGAGNDINGLTLGGVGSGTEIDYVEVFANFDDGIEWFGGTVNCKHLAVSFCGDDGMDYDYGWRGNGQYFFVMHGPGETAGRGGEHDGAKPDGEAPFSNPTIFNATYIGIGEDANPIPGGDGNDFALAFRDRAGGTYANSIFFDFPGQALTIEDLPAGDGDDTYDNLINQDLNLDNNIWFGFGGGTDLADLIEVFVDGDGDSTGVNTVAELAADGNTLEDPGICGISRTTDGGLDPRPEADGAAYVGVFSTEPAGDFFDDVTYKGAFESTENGNWLDGWSALSTLGYLSDGSLCNVLNTNSAFEQDGYLLNSINPNPAQNQVQINFALPVQADINMMVFDLNGRQVLNVLANETRGQGNHNVRANLSNLTSGQYIVTLEANGRKLSRNLIIQK